MRFFQRNFGGKIGICSQLAAHGRGGLPNHEIQRHKGAITGGSQCAARLLHGKQGIQFGLQGFGIRGRYSSSGAVQCVLFFRGFLLFLQRVQCGVAVILGTLGGGKCRIVGIFGGFLGAVQGILRSFQGSGGVFYGGLFFSVVRIAGIAGLIQSGSSFVPLGLGTGNALFTIGVDSVCFLVGTF